MAKDIAKGGNSLREAFGKALVELAPEHEFYVFDADVAGGTGVYHFRDAYPDRFVQCGIAEQAMVAAAAGATQTLGCPVFATTFATFGARAWEIFRLSVAYNDWPVILALSHLGLDVGPDGASAQSLEHYAIWRCLPDVRLVHPATGQQMTELVRQLILERKPAVLLTGRSEIPELNFEPALLDLAQIVYVSEVAPTTAFVASGHMVHRAIAKAKSMDAAMVLNVHTLQPIDRLGIESLLYAGVEEIVVFEDHSQRGGLYGAVCEIVRGADVLVIPQGSLLWGESAESSDLLEYYR